MSQIVICPVCGQSDQVDKVSTIYLAAAERRPPPGGETSLSERLRASEVQSQLKYLGKRLKPPSTGKGSLIRLVSPDLVVSVFTIIILVFLYGIWSSQRPMFIPVMVILAICYGLFFWRRHDLIQRFEQQQVLAQSTERMAQKAIESWMKLYYCARDDGVFMPGSDKLIPADQMSYYLLQPPGELPE